MICNSGWSYSSELVCDRLSKKKQKIDIFSYHIYSFAYKIGKKFSTVFFERPDEVLTLVSQ